MQQLAASGWGAELIPDEDTLQCQFPQVLAELEQQHARLAELQDLFAEASEEDFEDTDDTGVLPADDARVVHEDDQSAVSLGFLRVDQLQRLQLSTTLLVFTYAVLNRHRLAC